MSIICTEAEIMKAELQRLIQCAKDNDWDHEFTVCIISSFVNCWGA